MILVAGGTGRLGTALVQRLVDNGLPVRVLTREPGRAAHLVGGSVEVITADVCNRATLREAFHGVELVVSAIQGFAGPGGVSPKTVDWEGNRNLIDAAASVGADVVLMSVVGARRDSPMELFRMKHAAEDYLQASGVRWTIVRATAFLELWVELLEGTVKRSGRPLVFGRGNNPINFVSVVDVAALVERVVTDASTRGTTLQIGGPENLTFNEVAEALQARAHRSGKPRHVPPAGLWMMANTVGRMKPELGRQARAARAMDADDMTFDLSTSKVFPGLPRTSLAELLADRRA
ncbi:MAG: SDR family oxidoreductase [Tepidiformaceae bacterium]